MLHLHYRKLIIYKQEYNININIIPKLCHKEYINYLHKNKRKFKNEIDKLTVDFNVDNLTDEYYTCQWNSDITQKYLQLLGFEWPKINKEYIEKMVNYLQRINFL